MANEEEFVDVCSSGEGDFDDSIQKHVKKDTQKKKNKRKRKDPNKPKRPMSAYMLYSKAEFRNVMKANPGILMPNVAKLLGEKWKNLSAEEKEPFEAESQVDKKRYKEDKAHIAQKQQLAGAVEASMTNQKETNSVGEDGNLTCHNCAAEVKIPHDQGMGMRSLLKYDEQIKELKSQFQLKADECHQAWMLLTATNSKLLEAQKDLESFHNMPLGQEMTEELNEIITSHERDKMIWATAIKELVQIMKQHHSDLSFEAHQCAGSVTDLNKIVVAVQNLGAQVDDLKLKLNREQMRNKELHNQLMEAKGSIRVFCRCRPLHKEEISDGCQIVVDFSEAKDGELGIFTANSTKKMFTFDRVFTPEDGQVEVFSDASPLVLSVLDGYNVCILAYGQTGTGKTYTMEGPHDSRGVNYRTLEQLFKTIAERKEETTYDISLSVLEVYNEEIRDLLATSSTAKRLEVMQTFGDLNHIPGSVEIRVESVNEAWRVLQAGSKARAVASNNVNKHSSRSHCLVCTLVRAMNLITGECTASKLWLVDLAGCERLAKTLVIGERLTEAQNISRSLSALGDVMSALANKSSHIPYRHSKLTRLLEDSLGGTAKTIMFVQISPSESDLYETLSSLAFATRVQGVELGPARKQIETAEIQKLKARVKQLQDELIRERHKDNLKQYKQAGDSSSKRHR